MPMYDRQCSNGHKQFDLYEQVSDPDPVCPECGQPAERACWLSKSAGVIADEIPGGMEMKHGICNPDGSPRKFYSKSEIAREAAKRGWTNVVEHKPLPGSDKSPHTTRWV